MCTKRGQVAQLVEQRTENPRAEGSSPPLTTMNFQSPSNGALFLSEISQDVNPAKGIAEKRRPPVVRSPGLSCNPWWHETALFHGFRAL